MSQRAWRRGTGETKVTLNTVDAAREGQEHVGSTPTTSTILQKHHKSEIPNAFLTYLA